MRALQALHYVLSRYAQVFGVVWSMRRHLESPPRAAHELAFLPAQLELAETPVHPVPRLTMLILAALAAVSAAVAAFGQLDIVAVAKGKVVPTDRVKVIQPAITGVVRRIFVRDGQRVAAGESLIELDPTQAAADADKARDARLAAALAAARASALLEAQAHAHLPWLTHVDGANSIEQGAAQHFADGLYRELQDKLAGAAAVLSKREAELQTALHQTDKLRATAPLARRQADDFRSLVDQQFVARTEYLDKEQAALQQEHELAAQLSRAHELEAAITSQRADMASLSSMFRREQLDALDKATQQLAQGTKDEAKARIREQLMHLNAPVPGTVQQLSVHTLGGVVTTAQALMEIVPDDAPEIEATIENKDVGFVRPGQEVVVKVEAFPYTRYGYLHGTVRSISNDAVQDRRQGLSFVARVTLASDRVRVEEQWIPLTPGMAVIAEIKTGKRSVVRYFVDPLVQTSKESLRER